MSRNNLGALYVVATPIGNLDDISVRALATLKSVHAIAAEDTRHSQKLLTHFGITNKLFPYHDHSNEKQVTMLLDKLSSGQDLALISDAGTPLISDPGYRIVKEARASGIRVIPVPGASATISALCASGLPTNKFSFEGFPPAKPAARRAFFEELKFEERTMVFFESPHRIDASLRDAASVFGSERSASLARELTKTFETFLGPTLGDIHASVLADANQQRGEIVLVVAGAEKAQGTNESVTVHIDDLLKVLCSELPTKLASNLASELSGMSKKELYQRALKYK